MPDVNAGVVKVGPVLRVRAVADVGVIGPFVDVVDPVEVQEVGDQPFTVAPDQLTGECPVAGLPGRAVIAVRLVFGKVCGGVREQQAVEVPVVLERTPRRPGAGRRCAGSSPCHPPGPATAPGGASCRWPGR